MAFLEVIQGGCPGQIVPLTGNRMILGRHPNCEIVLDNAAVSRHHAQILQSHGNFYLEDLRSRNHTFLNQIPLQGRTELQDEDIIKICDFVFAFHTKRPSENGGDSSWVSEPPGRTVISSGKSGADSAPGEDGATAAAKAISNDERPSSIISTINAAPEGGLRLGVKPEVKLRAILSISRALAQTFQIDEVLQKTLEELFQVFPQADEGFILLQDPRSRKLVVSATKTRSGRPDDSVRISTTVVEKVMRDREAVLSHDASADARFEKSESLSKLRIRSMICVPLINPDGNAIGVIQLDAKDLRNQFTQDDLDVLVAIASQVALAVENVRMHEQMIKQRDMEEQMGLAVQVQLEFLPDSPPQLPGYEFFDFYEAALEVGGDYFDYIELSPLRVAILLGDVAGKGVPAALLMAKLSALARFQMLTKATMAEALDGLNAEISSRGVGHRFVTLAVALLDAKKHEVTIANAGHLPPLMRQADGTVLELGNDVAGTPLGIEPETHFRTATYPIAPGDILVLHTDGITEAMNDRQKVYGRQRLKKLLAKPVRNVQELGERILKDAETYAKDRFQRDDICLVCVQRTTQGRKKKKTAGSSTDRIDSERTDLRPAGKRRNRKKTDD